MGSRVRIVKSKCPFTIVNKQSIQYVTSMVRETEAFRPCRSVKVMVIFFFPGKMNIVPAPISLIGPLSPISPPTFQLMLSGRAMSSTSANAGHTITLESTLGWCGIT